MNLSSVASMRCIEQCCLSVLLHSLQWVCYSVSLPTRQSLVLSMQLLQPLQRRYQNLGLRHCLNPSSNQVKICIRAAMTDTTIIADTLIIHDDIRLGQMTLVFISERSFSDHVKTSAAGSDDRSGNGL